MRAVLCVLVLISLACNRGSPPPSTAIGPASAPARRAAPVEDPVADPADPPPGEEKLPPQVGEPPGGTVPIVPGGTLPVSGNPAELYAQCEGRVEQPEAAGECSADADCVKAGCSSEKCVTKATAAEVMSTCEIQPCFEVLDTCGCVAGTCRWSLKP